MSRLAFKRRSVLPGFGLSLGYATLYLSIIVLVPLATLFTKTAQLSWAEFRGTIVDPEVVAAFKVSFGCSLAASVVNAVFGLLTAWVLVRYSFPGRRLIDGLIDLPFALPTAVAGLVLSTLYSPGGWLGALGTNAAGWVNKLLTLVHFHAQLGDDALAWLNLDFANSRTGITIALTFVGLPFVIRTVQPVLQELDGEVEQAAASLGAGRWTTFRRVIFPELRPALLAGFAMAFARALGEYGSVIFISSNRPMETEIVPTLIYAKLEQYNYAGATAVAVVMLLASFVLLLIVNLLQRRAGAAIA